MVKHRTYNTQVFKFYLEKPSTWKDNAANTDCDSFEHISEQCRLE